MNPGAGGKRSGVDRRMMVRLEGGGDEKKRELEAEEILPSPHLSFDPRVHGVKNSRCTVSRWGVIR